MKNKALHPTEAMEQYRIQKNIEQLHLTFWLFGQMALVIAKSLLLVAVLGASIIIATAWYKDVSIVFVAKYYLTWLVAALALVTTINLVQLYFVLFGKMQVGKWE